MISVPSHPTPVCIGTLILAGNTSGMVHKILTRNSKSHPSRDPDGMVNHLLGGDSGYRSPEPVVHISHVLLNSAHRHLEGGEERREEVLLGNLYRPLHGSGIMK